jgi:hypothetical protein
MKLNTNTFAKTAIEASEKAKAMEMIAPHFSGKELLRIAQKLQSPVVRMKIKALL